jgi:hypothetical protein
MLQVSEDENGICTHAYINKEIRYHWLNMATVIT